MREAAERWAPHGVTIRFGVELTYDRSWEADIRDHLARHRYDFTIGSVHDRVDSPYAARRVAAWVGGRSLAEIVAPSFDEVVAAARSGLFDTIGHIDVVKRYLWPHVTAGPARRRARALRADPRGARRVGHRAGGQHERAAPSGPGDLPVGGDRGPVPGRSAAGGSPSARTRTGSNHFGVGPRRRLRLGGGGRLRVAGVRRGAAGSSTCRERFAARPSGPMTRRVSIELVVLGAGPAYTDRPGATGAAYLAAPSATGTLLLDLGQGSFPSLAAELEPSDRSRRSWSPTCIPTTSSTSSRFGTTCAGTCTRRGRVRVLGPVGLATASTGSMPNPASARPPSTSRRSAGSATIGRSRSRRRWSTHTDESYGVPRLRRRRRRASSTRATAVAPRTWTR